MADMWNPPNPKDYNAKVWLIVRHIPHGHVLSYGQIAAMIPAPDGEDPEQFRRLGARWVGTALKNVGNDIPWWRVINSKGAISLPAGSAAADEQRRRLELEEIAFNKKDQVDFAVYGWNDIDESWLDENGLQAP
jgi:methylated-DNA-protein-cysteine methyltransferase related protein